MSTSGSAAPSRCAASTCPSGAGQCLGLVGRNGAGKSTLVSILSGLADAGRRHGAVRRRALRRGSATSAGWREWIATVFQHSMVVPDLSVAENVFLGGADRFVSWRAMRARTREIMRDWGFDIDAETLCRDLTVEQLQIVEIARALARGARCVLLDEPTAALEREAVRRLFERVRQLADSGVAVLYISHHLEEVFEICQDVAVLRDGELVLTAPVAAAQQGGPGRGDGGISSGSRERSQPGPARPPQVTTRAVTPRSRS